MSSSSGSRRSFARRAAEAVAPALRDALAERDHLRRRAVDLELLMAEAQRELRDLRERLASLERSARAEDGRRGRSGTELGYLFVVSYGRSGSTLLQGLLNTIPGYLIRGENRAAPYRLWQFHETLSTARGEFGRRMPLTSRDSFFGIDEYRSAEAVARLRDLMLDCVLLPANDTRTVGFKEIRWNQRDWPDYVRFLTELFPGARFVINTREHADVVRSQWWRKFDEATALAQLAEHERQFDEMAAMLGGDAFRVHYDDYVADPGVLEKLWGWLDEPFDRAAVDAVLGVRHSF